MNSLVRFTADGVRLPDPSNPQVKIGYVTSTTTSLFTVPGEGPAFYDVRDVPHGEIRTLLYKSRSNGTFLETEGAHHWRVWRRYLRDLAPLLFK